MSSYLRTIEKRMLKRAGYVRQTQKIVQSSGVPTVVRLKRGQGPILDAGGDPIGQHWPSRVPAVEGAGAPKRKGAPRGSRRGKRTKGIRSTLHLMNGNAVRENV